MNQWAHVYAIKFIKFDDAMLAFCDVMNPFFFLMIKSIDVGNKGNRRVYVSQITASYFVLSTRFISSK